MPFTYFMQVLIFILRFMSSQRQGFKPKNPALFDDFCEVTPYPSCLCCPFPPIFNFATNLWARETKTVTEYSRATNFGFIQWQWFLLFSLLHPVDCRFIGSTLCDWGWQKQLTREWYRELPVEKSIMQVVRSLETILLVFYKDISHTEKSLKNL